MKLYSRFSVPVTAALPLVALATSAWAGALRSPDRGLDRATLVEDSQYMRRVFEAKAKETSRGAAGGEAIAIDLADPGQYRFVMNRLRGSGKTAANAPKLFQRLNMARERALARKAGGAEASLTTLVNNWGCDHFFTLSRGVTNANMRTYTSNPWASCLNGASYVYTDIVAYNSNMPETESAVVDSASGEEYAAGQSFDDVIVRPAIPINLDRQVIVDTMMIAMNENTGEEVVTFARGASAATSAGADLTMQHPRLSVPGSMKFNTELCQMRGGIDCDYAAVGSTLAPSGSSPATGVALRNTAVTTSWVGDAANNFPVSGAWNATHVYVPTQFTFNAGSKNGVQCVIKEILPGSKVRLVKPVTGGTCMSQMDLAPALASAINATSANVKILSDLTRETSIAGTGTESCATQAIINQAVEYVITVSTKVNCGTAANTPATVTVRMMSDERYRYGLMVWNSCMAEGTKVVLADGRTVPVEQVQRGARIVTNDQGEALTVTDVQVGGELEPMVNLVDDKGHKVSLTDKHPVIMADGKPVAAGTLRVNDRVSTRDGVATLTSVTREKYAGKVYNFNLGTAAELARAGKNANTLFANGFRVGDNKMQGDLTAPVADSREVLERLPAAWHQDYANSAAFVAGQR
ncbi:Hint domain-containing protein [Myxococcus stipitatus]|uniref:Hint domain-containing protein n=1 Tax=Myxococcus stipitatus TaxID=83455 RepID=UPI0030CACFCA